MFENVEEGCVHDDLLVGQLKLALAQVLRQVHDLCVVGDERQCSPKEMRRMYDGGGRKNKKELRSKAAC